MSFTERKLSRREALIVLGAGYFVGRNIMNGVRRIDNSSTSSVETIPDQEAITRANRLEELFQKYGSPMTNQDLQPFMVQMENTYNIKLEVIGAIMYADSSLATNLTTPFNPGNVNNTDSCPTCQSFSSWQEGIEAIFHTLSTENPYLADKHTLGELSCGGYISRGIECQRPVYASSSQNWHNNTTAFLNEFFNTQDKTIYNDYRFRK